MDGKMTTMMMTRKWLVLDHHVQKRVLQEQMLRTRLCGRLVGDDMDTWARAIGNPN
jgi:hypothetical protein